MPLYRAYSSLEVKSVDDGRRLIRGTASTPTPDRQGHIIEPQGVTFAAEIPLLLHHNKETPVGVARLRREGNAIAFEAELPVIDEPGPVQAEVDRAWTSILHRLIRGVSIGWLPMGEASIEVLKNGMVRFLRSEICELSLVTVPANTDATIARIKALDLDFQAAAGLCEKPSPGDSGPPVERPPQRPLFRMTTETIGETIRSYETSLAAKQAQIDAILNGAREQHLTLDPAQRESCDTLQGECDGIIDTLNRFRAREKSLVATATPVPPAANGRPATAVPAISVKATAPPGTGFTRAICSLVQCKGNKLEAAQYATERWPDMPEVGLYLKAAVAAGTSTHATWAGPLVQPANLANEFVALLRPATAIGKIAGLRQVPFGVKVPAQTGGGTYNWVGEGKPKPVTSLAFSSTTLDVAKAAGIIVLTEELARLSSPAAEDIARTDMINGIVAFVDAQFLDPAVAAVTGQNPASITNGVTPITSVGPLNDIVAIARAFTAANVPISGLTFIMSPANALVLSFQKDALGALAFPGMSTTGGNVNGLQVVTSAAAGTNIIGVIPSLVLYGDDGGVTVDVSREASVQMNSAPMDPADATTVYVNFWQNNLVGLRAEWFVSWKKAHADAVKYVASATFVIPAPAAMSVQADAGNGGKRARGE